MIFVDVAGEIALLVLTSDYMAYVEKNGWEISCIMLGTSCICGLAWLMYLAHKAVAVYRQDLAQHPPLFQCSASEKLLCDPIHLPSS